jgi:hypothetical protein
MCYRLIDGGTGPVKAKPLNLPGGTLVACEKGNWSIEDDESRLVYVPVSQGAF